MSEFIFLDSIFVGAPRANSSLPEQLYITEPGAIYKCNLENPASTRCEPFVFDSSGNNVNEMKNYRWLGGSMDGSPNDGGKLVVGNFIDKC